MRKVLLQSLVGVSVLVSVGCQSGLSVNDVVAGNNNDRSSIPESPTPVPPPSTPLPTPTPDGSITAAQLTGAWQGPCQLAGDQSLTNKLTFAGTNQVSDRTLVYSGSGCGGDAIVIVNMVGTYLITGLSPTVSQATNLTINVVQVTGTPTSDFVASQLNFVSYCGYSDWEANKAHSVSLNNACLAGLPLQGNQIARITGNNFYFGNSSKTAIDLSVAYGKR